MNSMTRKNNPWEYQIRYSQGLHIYYDDARVKRSKSRSCLHDKAFELGTRQTWESSDLRSKSADFECLQNCGSCFAAEQFVGISWGQNTFCPNNIILYIRRGIPSHFTVGIPLTVLHQLYSFLTSYSPQLIIHGKKRKSSYNTPQEILWSLQASS